MFSLQKDVLPFWDPQPVHMPNLPTYKSGPVWCQLDLIVHSLSLNICSLV